MAISKVIYGENTLIDLTADTVIPETLAAGATAHNAAGEPVVGTVTMLSIDEIAQLAAQKVDKESLGLNNVDNVINCEADEEIENAIKAEWATMADNSIKHIELALNGGDYGLHSGNWQVTLHQTNARYGTVTAINYYYGGIAAQRCLFDGVWGDWEWVNPPMAVGQEYRTTERYNGKPVFAKLIYCGRLPNNERISVDVLVSASDDDGGLRIVESVVDIKPILRYDEDYYYTGHKNLEFYFVADTGNIWSENWIEICTSDNLSGWEGWFLVKWTEA